MTDRTVTDYALWWGTDSPGDPGADIRTQSSWSAARYEFAHRRHGDDPPRGICRRECQVIEGEWEIEETT